MSFEKAYKETLGHEGKYSNDPRDSGGETMYGITIAVARKHGYTGPMRTMPLAVAQGIYKRSYWDAIQLDSVDAIAPRVAAEMFDTGVNMGTKRAVTFLQQCLNVLNNRGKLYPDITEDGAMGPRTLAALREYMKIRKLEGETVLLRMLNVLQGAFYVELASRRQKDEAFIFGWFRTRINVPNG